MTGRHPAPPPSSPSTTPRQTRRGERAASPGHRGLPGLVCTAWIGRRLGPRWSHMAGVPGGVPPGKLSGLAAHCFSSQRVPGRRRGGWVRGWTSLESRPSGSMGFGPKCQKIVLQSTPKRSDFFGGSPTVVPHRARWAVGWSSALGGLEEQPGHWSIPCDCFSGGAVGEGSGNTLIRGWAFKGFCQRAHRRCRPAAAARRAVRHPHGAAAQQFRKRPRPPPVVVVAVLPGPAAWPGCKVCLVRRRVPLVPPPPKFFLPLSEEIEFPHLCRDWTSPVNPHPVRSECVSCVP